MGVQTADPHLAGPSSSLERLAAGGLVALPGALTVFLSFNGGGFFPGTPALVAVVLLLVLASRIFVAPIPFAGLSRQVAVAAGALGAYALWTGLSAIWSDSAWRAMVELDRVLLYLAALVLFGSVARDPVKVRWMVRTLALGILVVCTVGLITRLLPDVWPIEPNLDPSRLSYPVTYWNTFGLMAAIGTIFCFHLSSSRSEPWQLRVAGAGAVPILVTTLYLTFSRGAILAGMVGLLTYMAVGRPQALLSGLLATVPTTAIAVVAAYRAELLSSPHPASDAAVAQGHDFALTIGLCIVLTLIVRLILVALDRRIGGIHVPERARRPLLWSLMLAVGVAMAVGATVADAPDYLSRQYDRFVHEEGAGDPADVRTRLTDPGSNGRVDQWRVAVNDGFDPAKLTGQGAGTYELVWSENRPKGLADLTVHDAHSLYLENLSDLGLIGFVLVVTFVITILYGFAARLRDHTRTLYAALFAAGLTWALHAAIDWDWEMPAATLWLFAMGGAALAAPKGRPEVRSPPTMALRFALGGAVILISIGPALVTVSQGKLDDAVQTFLQRGDCPDVIDEANSASSVMPLRPEPYRLEGYCQARLGQAEAAVESMRKAAARDSHNWEYQYSLAVAQAAAGIDPGAATKRAVRLNPFSAATLDLQKRFRSADPRELKQQAAALLDAPVF